MPAYVRKSNQFIDPAGLGPVNPAGGRFAATYNWTINHHEEEEVQNSRGITDGAPTSDIGLLPQQGPPKPLVFQWKGTLFTQADKDAMDSWFELCESQSIYLNDFNSNQYEILITDWNVKRTPVAWNHRGQVPWIWDYTITIRVLTVLAGDWSGRTP